MLAVNAVMSFAMGSGGEVEWGTVWGRLLGVHAQSGHLYSLSAMGNLLSMQQ